MKRNLVVLQEDKYDCAAASLLSIIKYYGGYLNLESIRNLIGTTKGGTNAYGLVNGSKEIGFDSFGRKVSFADIEKKKDLFPVIAHVKKNNMYHFVVIYKVDSKNKKFVIMDPSIGMIKQSFKEFENNYLGVLIFFTKVKEIPKEKNDNKLLKIIISSLLKDKKILIILSTLSLITFIFSLLDTIYYKIIIDTNFKNITNIQKYAFLFSTFSLLKNLFIFFRNKLSIKVNKKIEILINKETLNRIFSLPYSYYKNKTTGEITSRINDLDTLRELLSSLMLNTFVDVLLIVISFIIMFILNKRLTSVSILIICLYIIIIKLYKTKFNKSIKLIQESKGYYNNKLIENIEGIETINNLNIKNIKIKELEKCYKNTCDEVEHMNLSYNKQHFFKNIIYDLGLIFILTTGVLMVYYSNITIGDLILIYMIISYFLNIIRNLLDKEIDISYTLKNLNKVNNMLIETKENINSQKLNGDIKISNLNFKYGSNNSIINIKKLIIKEKSKVLITGTSGSGKSTFLKVILGYLDNYNGNIYIGEKNMKSLNFNIKRNSFTYIGQNEKIFTDTFKNNITLGRNISNNEYKKVLKICELEELINKRSFKEEFLIEESGFNISGGERERIILARGLLKESNYIFIDEALSEVNYKLEKKIVKNILENYKDKTIIYISHKDKIKELFTEIYNIERSEHND